MKKQISVYIHIPFCKSKCKYCTFYSLANEESKIADYFLALEKEIEFYQEKLKAYEIKTVYLGGGTPGLVEAKYIEKVLKKFDLDKCKEITLETNPEQITKEKLKKYKEMGIDRISIGLQSCNNSLLKFMGRNYDIKLFDKNLKLTQKYFDNIALDLIFGLAKQTLGSWEQTLDKVISYNVNHIACYSLELDKESVFGKLFKERKLRIPSEEVNRKMYHLAQEKLKEAGYIQYEISNWAKEGRECLHNKLIWQGEEYLGLGAAAHSFWENKQFNNIYSLSLYIKKILLEEMAIDKCEIISKENLMWRNLMLGLRLNEGVDLDKFKKKYNYNILQKLDSEVNSLINDKLINIENGKIKLTDKGMDLENLVVGRLIKIGV